jgi:hypothetical protein
MLRFSFPRQIWDTRSPNRAKSNATIAQATQFDRSKYRRRSNQRRTPSPIAKLTAQRSFSAIAMIETTDHPANAAIAVAQHAGHMIERPMRARPGTR